MSHASIRLTRAQPGEHIDYIADSGRFTITRTRDGMQWLLMDVSGAAPFTHAVFGPGQSDLILPTLTAVRAAIAAVLGG